MAGDELDMEPKIEALNVFLEQQIEHCSTFVERMEIADVDEEVLDELLRDMLREVWTGAA